MDVIQELSRSLLSNDTNAAFNFSGNQYTYGNFSQAISNVRALIRSNCGPEEKHIGILAEDDLLTYASIVAVWFEGKAYVPILGDTPRDRIKSTVDQAELKTILSSKGTSAVISERLLGTKDIPNVKLDLTPLPNRATDLAYIIFTSGSTGTPKGVPITVSNLGAFAQAFDNKGISINHRDRCLQMFDLTFDFSVMAYLIPLLKGACLYPVPKGVIKYTTIFEMMEDHELTVAPMVPSILNYLRPYFEEIHLPAMRYSIFCGEALYLEVCEEWGKCLPNAELINYYGPTEATVFCTQYNFRRQGLNKAHNGVLSVGTGMKGTEILIIGHDDQELTTGEVGEICLAGTQVTPGYWNDTEGRNSTSFFQYTQNGHEVRYYKTGDLAYKDSDGDIMYVGRVDHQVKIQGFRIELAEVEYHARAYLGTANVVALVTEDEARNNELDLIVEGLHADVDGLSEYLSSKMAAYMQPRSIKCIEEIPLSANGKFDRVALKKSFHSPK